MNLTAEQIDTIRWAYKNPDIDALADMAKRTLEAEAQRGTLTYSTEGGWTPLGKIINSLESELAALKNAATGSGGQIMGRPGDVNSAMRANPQTEPVSNTEPKPHATAAESGSSPDRPSPAAAPDLVERLKEISAGRGRDAQQACKDAAAALAEREKFAAVFDELARATVKFPTWPSDPLHAVAVLGEEFGELTKGVLQLTYEPHKTSMDEVRTEAIQTAAMALRFVMSLDAYQFERGEQHQQDALRGRS